MTARAAAVLAWLVDAALVTAFVAVGRESHGEDLAGLVATLLPFLAALQTGWLLLDRGHWFRPLRSGVPVWLTTVVLGLLLRVASGDTAAFPFVVVTTLTLGVALVGWRVVATAILALRARRRDRSAAHD